MALDSQQPIGHLCDLLGVSRRRPGVFQAMVDLLYEDDGGDAARTVRLDDVRRRMTGRP